MSCLILCSSHSHSHSHSRVFSRSNGIPHIPCSRRDLSIVNSCRPVVSSVGLSRSPITSVIWTCATSRWALRVLRLPLVSPLLCVHIPSALRAYPLCSARVSSGELAPGLTCLGCLVSCLRASTARLAGLAARGGCCCYHWPPLEAGLCRCLASAARGPLLRAVPRACCSPLRPGRPRP